MSATLAADAASVELSQNEDVDVVLRDAANGDEPNPLAVRDALLELAKLNAEAEQIDKLKRQIVERYVDKVKSLAGRAQALRDSLEVYATRYGKVSFPDVGGIHLTTQNKGGKAIVSDAVVFEDWIRSTHAPIAQASIETVEVFDRAKALELVLDEFGVVVTAGGSLVDATTGEDKTDAFEKVGVEIVPESKTLAVRKS